MGDRWFEKKEERVVEDKRKLVFCILKRVVNFREVRDDTKIDFDQMVGILQKAMNLR